MLMLRLLTRKYEFKDDTEREPLAQVAATAFPALLAIFQVRQVYLEVIHLRRSCATAEPASMAGHCCKLAARTARKME